MDLELKSGQESGLCGRIRDSGGPFAAPCLRFTFPAENLEGGGEEVNATKVVRIKGCGGEYEIDPKRGVQEALKENWGA